MTEKALVIKFGGSEAATGFEGAKIGYLHNFLSSLGSDLLDTYSQIGLVIGGGPRVRVLQAQVDGNSEKNLVAREAMWEHAETLRQVAQSVGLETVSAVPHSPEEMSHILGTDKSKVMVMSWLKDGQSSDASSVLLAEKWKKEIAAVEIVMLSNIAYIFTSDPGKFADARAITRSSVRQLVKEKVLSDDPTSFLPGDHVVIDAVAVSHLVRKSNSDMPLFFGHGNNLADVGKFLNGNEPSQGTILHDRYLQTSYLD